MSGYGRPIVQPKFAFLFALRKMFVLDKIFLMSYSRTTLAPCKCLIWVGDSVAVKLSDPRRPTR